MGTRTVPFALLALLSLPVAASAQPTLYVCTPSARILKVNAGAPSVLYTGTGRFDDCVLGPDGRLYVANDNNILQLDPTSPTTALATATFIASGLQYTVKALAFNVTTLYITAAVPPSGKKASPTGAVYRLIGTPPDPVDGVNTGGPLEFTGTPSKLFDTSAPTSGIVFDVVGNLIVASDSRLDSAPPPYTGLSSPALVPSGIAAVGVAVNTCKQVVYADTATNTIRRVGSTQVLASFSEFPLYLEVDSSNVLYVVTNAKLDGAGAAKIWSVNLGFGTTNCTPSAVIPHLIADLKTALPSGTPADAIGIAVAATDITLPTITFSATHCADEYDFGYHRVTLEFTDCANTFLATGANATIEVKALKSTLSDTTFVGSEFANTPKPIEGMRYSPMGGFIVQYPINVVSSSGFNAGAAPVRLIYHFDTQETILAPGVAKTEGTGDFNENVGTDYWEAGKLDPPAGERGDTCCSRHVVYNAGAVTAAQCTFAFDQPFRSGNPLFNSGSQTIAISGSATNSRFNCDGGELRVSLFKHEAFPSNVTPSCANREQATNITFLTATSNIQTDNIMDVQQNKYKYNLQTKDLTSGVYLLTLAGPLHTDAQGTIGSLQIKTACFQFSK
jgi:hypothetical protein